MISVRLWPTAARTIARTFGVRGAALRALHELRRSRGRFRHRPRFPLAGAGMEPLASFVVDADRLRKNTDLLAARVRADRVVAGQYEAYRWDWRPFPASAEDWRTNARTGFRYAADEPWWRVAHLSAAAGDIKDVWEPARFGWLYDLVRGWLVTDEPRYARAAYDRVASWAASSEPFRGVHWSCGQETAIRAIALVYAEANFASAADVTDADRRLVRDLLAASGERIADAIGYAISQRNNHAISEAAGLVVLGARFRGAHPDAARWLRTGRNLLERLIPEQFAGDGWYIQHSFTYLRLALDQCVVAERALRSLGIGLSDASTNRLRAAARLLIAVLDSPSGIVPNHGANDGAFVHPVTLARCRDFRPVVTAACALFGESLPGDIAPDRETLAWLGANAPAAATPRADGVVSGASGWAAARMEGTAVFLRAGRYHSRPSHVDALQLDVRLGGREVVVDPGSYAYNAPAPWRNGLVTARVHNGPLVDGEEPGIRGPRFLWLAWPRAELVAATADADGATLVAQLPGRARRTVWVGAGGVEVADEVLAPGRRSMRIVWLLHPDVTAAEIACSAPVRVVEAIEDDVTGWFSPCYGERLPSRAVLVESTDGTPIRSRVGASRDDADQSLSRRPETAVSR